MRNSKFTETQIVAILQEADAGVPVNEVCRKHGISSLTYYKWKAKWDQWGQPPPPPRQRQRPPQPTGGRPRSAPCVSQGPDVGPRRGPFHRKLALG